MGVRRRRVNLELTQAGDLRWSFSSVTQLMHNTSFRSIEGNVL
jgi:hypothetical protein